MSYYNAFTWLSGIVLFCFACWAFLRAGLLVKTPQDDHGAQPKDYAADAHDDTRMDSVRAALQPEVDTASCGIEAVKQTAKRVRAGVVR